MASKSKRILVGKAEREKRRQELSHDEVAAAIRRFQEQGGLIKELPAEQPRARRLVGGHVETAWERVIDH